MQGTFPDSNAFNGNCPNVLQALVNQQQVPLVISGVVSLIYLFFTKNCLFLFIC